MLFTVWNSVSSSMCTKAQLCRNVHRLNFWEQCVIQNVHRLNELIKYETNAFGLPTETDTRQRHVWLCQKTPTYQVPWPDPNPSSTPPGTKTKNSHQLPATPGTRTGPRLQIVDYIRTQDLDHSPQTLPKPTCIFFGARKTTGKKHAFVGGVISDFEKNMYFTDSVQCMFFQKPPDIAFGGPAKNMHFALQNAFVCVFFTITFQLLTNMQHCKIYVVLFLNQTSQQMHVFCTWFCVPPKMHVGLGVWGEWSRSWSQVLVLVQSGVWTPESEWSQVQSPSGYGYGRLCWLASQLVATSQIARSNHYCPHLPKTTPPNAITSRNLLTLSHGKTPSSTCANTCTLDQSTLSTHTRSKHLVNMHFPRCIFVDLTCTFLQR